MRWSCCILPRKYIFVAIAILHLKLERADGRLFDGQTQKNGTMFMRANVLRRDCRGRFEKFDQRRQLRKVSWWAGGAELGNLSPVNIPRSDNWKYHSPRIVATCKWLHKMKIIQTDHGGSIWLNGVQEYEINRFPFRDSLRPRWAGRRFWQIFR